jgi:hypothetical protein
MDILRIYAKKVRKARLCLAHVPDDVSDLMPYITMHLQQIRTVLLTTDSEGPDDGVRHSELLVFVLGPSAVVLTIENSVSDTGYFRP